MNLYFLSLKYKRFTMCPCKVCSVCSHDGGGPGVEHVVLVHVQHNLRPRRGRRPPRMQLRPEVMTVEVGGERGLEAGRGQKGGEPVGDVDKPRVGFRSISIQLHQSHTLRSWCPSSCDGEVDCGQSPRLGLRLQQGGQGRCQYHHGSGSNLRTASPWSP